MRCRVWRLHYRITGHAYRFTALDDADNELPIANFKGD